MIFLFQPTTFILLAGWQIPNWNKIPCRNCNIYTDVCASLPMIFYDVTVSHRNPPKISEDTFLSMLYTHRRHTCELLKVCRLIYFHPIDCNSYPTAYVLFRDNRIDGFLCVCVCYAILAYCYMAAVYCVWGEVFKGIDRGFLFHVTYNGVHG